MSRVEFDGLQPRPGFPRVSGDEPITLDVQGATVEFSPRERG